MHLALAVFAAALQAAYAYSVISSQAASVVVGAMDKMWSGQQQMQNPALSAMAAANEQQQQARLGMALSDAGDSDNVYVQVSCT